MKQVYVYNLSVIWAQIYPRDALYTTPLVCVLKVLPCYIASSAFVYVWDTRAL